MGCCRVLTCELEDNTPQPGWVSDLALEPELTEREAQRSVTPPQAQQLTVHAI